MVADNKVLARGQASKGIGGRISESLLTDQDSGSLWYVSLVARSESPGCDQLGI